MQLEHHLLLTPQWRLMVSCISYVSCSLYIVMGTSILFNSLHHSHLAELLFSHHLLQSPAPLQPSVPSRPHPQVSASPGPRPPPLEALRLPCIWWCTVEEASLLKAGPIRPPSASLGYNQGLATLLKWLPGMLWENLNQWLSVCRHVRQFLCISWIIIINSYFRFISNGMDKCRACMMFHEVFHSSYLLQHACFTCMYVSLPQCNPQGCP